MDASLDLTSIFVTDFVGTLLLFIILITGGWDLPTRKEESRILFCIIIASIVDCLMDAFVSYCDGKPDPLLFSISMVGNTYLYLYNLAVGIAIIYLIVKHVDKQLPKIQIQFFAVVSIVEVSLLIINFFSPLVFYLDDNNTYHRGPFYWVFVLAAFLLILYGYLYYFVSKLTTPSLRYFPAWEFLLPILMGLIIQSRLYGISLLPVSFAIAFCGLVICLQNESIYIDKLTGVYNRFELEEIRKDVIRKRREKIAALMIDLNGFKSINDDYSHAEGDNALMAFADILVKVVKTDGTVIRFAGDEFIIIFRKFKEDNISGYKERIRKGIEEYNETSGKPYKLSAAVGGDVFESRGRDISDLLSNIDSLMYKEKDEYYKIHKRER